MIRTTANGVGDLDTFAKALEFVTSDKDHTLAIVMRQDSHNVDKLPSKTKSY